MTDSRFGLEKTARSDDVSLVRAGYHSEADYLDAYGYGYDHETGADGFRLKSVWRAIRKHKWLVTTVPIIVTMLVTVEMNRPKTTYFASATIEIKKDTWVMVKSGDSIIEEEADTALSSATIKTNTLMLKSRPLLQDVVTKLALSREPRFFDIRQPKRPFVETLKNLLHIGKTQERSNPQSQARYQKTSEVEHTEANKAGEDTEQQSMMSEEGKALLTPYVRLLQDWLSVEPIKDTRALRIGFTHTDPNIAAAVVNAVAESFIEHRFQNRSTKLNQATAWLERTTRDLKIKVEKAEQALADYSREHNIYAPDAKDTLTSDKLSRLHSEALRAETDSMLKESLYEEVRAGRIAQLPEAFTDPKAGALQAQLGQFAVAAAELEVSYGPKYPPVIEVRQKMAAIQQQIDASRTALEEKLKADYARAIRDEQTLKTALKQAKSEAVEQNQDTVQFNLLKQDADTARLLYTQFLQKTNQANIQLAEQPSTVRLIEPAEVPSEAAPQNLPLYIFLGFFFSLAACIGLAFLFEHLDKTIKSVEDVNRYVELPAIGVIPEIKAQSSRHLLATKGKAKENGGLAGTSISRPARLNSRPIVSLGNRSVAAEAYRAVSTSVLLSSGESPPKTLLITSGLPGEGKTTTVINTAISLAQFGASVLIIDCDLRNPTSHKVFELEGARGLSTYLSNDVDGSVDIDSLICELKIPNLYLLPAGPIPDNPAKLIISRKMKNLLQTLSARYDHILIDSPPLIGVTDPIILSTLVDGVIVVVHGNKSTRERARRTRNELSIAGANIFGVVLNNLDYTDYRDYQPAYKYANADSEGP